MSRIFKYGSIVCALLMIVIAGCSSGSDDVILDTDPPELVAVTVTNYNSIVLEFSERLDPSSAQNKNAYTVTQTGPTPSNPRAGMPESKLGPGDKATILSALVENGSFVRLTTEPLEVGAAHEVVVNGVMDESGNSIGTAKKVATTNVEKGVPPGTSVISRLLTASESQVPLAGPAGDRGLGPRAYGPLDPHV